MAKQEIEKHKEDSLTKRDWEFEVSPPEAKMKLHAIKLFQAVVKEQLQKGHDYGIIPGTGNKPTLLKPGAEKIVKLLNCYDDYEILNEVECWDDTNPFFQYKIKCTLSDIGTSCKVSSGIGSCNSKESKYRWRWVPVWDLTDEQKKHKDEVPMQKRQSRKDGKEYVFYRFDNDDIFSQVNTIMKMARKRALIDAALSAGRLSDLFTQDLEDLANTVKEPEPELEEDEPLDDEEKSPGDRLASDQHMKITRLEVTLIDEFKLDPAYISDKFQKEFKKKSIQDLTESEATDWIKLLESKIRKEEKKIESKQA